MNVEIVAFDSYDKRWAPQYRHRDLVMLSFLVPRSMGPFALGDTWQLIDTADPPPVPLVADPLFVDCETTGNPTKAIVAPAERAATVRNAGRRFRARSKS